MKTWRLVSGILCCALGAYVFYQTQLLSMYLALARASDNGVSGGMLVVVLLVVSGVVSIICRGGGKGGNICLTITFPIAALAAFSSAAVYQDLIIWGAWCVACGIVAIINFVTGYGEPD